MIPKFKINNDHPHFIDDKYISNGYWAVTHKAASSVCAPKPLTALLNWKKGRYQGKNWLNGNTLDIEAVIPKRDGYTPMQPAPFSVAFRNGTEIMAYKYQAGDMPIGIAPQYVSLLMLGKAFAKSPKDAIIVLESENLNSEILAVIMPIKLEQAACQPHFLHIGCLLD